MIEDVHFFLFLSFCWVRSNLLNWDWVSPNICPKLLGLSLPGVGKCSLHLSWPGMYIMSFFFMVVILYRLWLYLLGLLRGFLLALALCRYYVYAMGLFLVWGSGGRY